ncbi:prevent-host-death family protein [Allomeiothermus silvanus DSM 9946]|uniref:Antitoxin n=1 Tax=Allomeiothermus silvanus (strain ATCC 700542 / DSM 9946 / NBRC 106475 / NCIMB 13440 / VI-R2) TaxID=526227 RepID=D7BGP9_ALLS1|nr:type II toxin-antitoxin system prevent-host-death family antitoxin [Allomeiothermus silvanus]ADH62053.1 prevent-host-death family protein [Allomeiothermus silvanus DSM 9946]
MKIVTVHQAKQQLSELLERVHAGEEVVVSKYGKPYAKLVPLGPEIRFRWDFCKARWRMLFLSRYLRTPWEA